MFFGNDAFSVYSEYNIQIINVVAFFISNKL